jgi:uracil-DNA glycosylase
VSWAEARRNLLRKELACLESEVALCERCYGDTPRHTTRFDRPDALPRVLVLTERPPRRFLESEERLALEGDDPGTRFLRELVAEAGIREEDVLLGAACLCRPGVRELERVVSSAVCVAECSTHVRELVRIVAPRLLVALGAEAVRSLKAAFPDSAAIGRIRFPGALGTTVDAGGTFVRIAYQTTARARVTRRADAQRRDWQAVGELWRWILEGEHGPPPSCSALAG